MSPDANNNSDDESDDVESTFKYTPIIEYSSQSDSNNSDNNDSSIGSELSCLAVHDKFLVIGKRNGQILIFDHAGTPSNQFKIQPHAYPVNAVSVDLKGEFIGSCCEEGKVRISGLFSSKDDQLLSFNRPIKAICLDPKFSQTKMFLTADATLILNERGVLGRHKRQLLIEPNGDLIHTIEWKDPFIGFANKKGVGIFDLHDRKLIGFVENDPMKDIPTGLFPARMSWDSPTTLAVTSGKSVTILSIKSRIPLDNPNSSRYRLDTINKFAIEFFACGITSIQQNLLILGIEKFSISSDTLEPSLTILTPKDRSYQEDVHDPFSFLNEKQILPYQLQLKYLADENCFLILTPFQLIKAEHRDYDDHIDFLIECEDFEEAIKAFEQRDNQQNIVRRHTEQTVYEPYLNWLMERGEYKSAVKYFQRIYITRESWTKSIRIFDEKNQLEIIVPHIPFEQIVLEQSDYEKVLQKFLETKNYRILVETLRRWPSKLYDAKSFEQKIRIADSADASKELQECLAIIAEKQGDVMRTLQIYLSMQNKQIFQLIERSKLYDQVIDKLVDLMSIDLKIALDLLLRHTEEIPIEKVVKSLGKQRRFLFEYLDAIFSRKSDDSRDFHSLQVELYAEFAPEKLMNFLRKAGNYNLQEAISLCETKKFYREIVFLYGRAGNGFVALQIILNQLDDIEAAIHFCRSNGSPDLWNKLIEESVNKPKFIKGLLNNAGGDIDLQQLIEQIPATLRVPNLRDSLCKIMQDNNIQMSLSECCRKIIVNDCLALRGKTIDLIQHGYPVRENEICAKCHSSIYDSGRLSNNCPVSVFYCFHVFHTKCIEKHQETCIACSTSSVFTSKQTDI